MLRRWTFVFALLVVWTKSISLLPITEENGSPRENERPTRQLNFEDNCCPCPGSETLNPSGQSRDLVALPDTSRSASSLAADAARAVDDCPCLVRDSDAAASSLFNVPGKMLGFGPVVKPNESRKEDPKPLLHPEVGLASSVLQTLREATDEEYQEALARDATKSVSRSVDDLISDPAPGASKNVVTIILNPHPLPDGDDDIITSGKHFHESRCIHPLGSTRSSSIISTPMDISKSHLLSELFKNPLSGDNHLAESNVAEIVVESPKKEDTKIMFKSPTNKLLSDDKATNLRSAVIESNPETFSGESVLEDKTKKTLNKSVTRTTKKKPDLSASLLALNERINKINDIISKPLIPRLKGNERKMEDSSSTESIRKSNLDADSSLASSNVQVIAARSNNQESKMPDLKLISSEDIVRSLIKPIIPTNFFKLKDAELIPKTVIEDVFENKGTNTNMPNLKLPSLDEIIARAKENAPEPMQIPSLTDLFRNVWSSTTKNENINDVFQKKITPNANVNEMNKIKTEILDTVPSPSENVEIISDTKNAEIPDLNSHLCNTEKSSENFEDAKPAVLIENIDSQTNNVAQASIVENGSSAGDIQNIEESSEINDPSAIDSINQDDVISETSNINTVPAIKTEQDVSDLCNQDILSQNLSENTTPVSKLDSKERPNILKNSFKLKKPSASILDHLKKTPILKIKPDTHRNTDIIESVTNTPTPSCNEIQLLGTTASLVHTNSTETSDETEDSSEVSVQDLQNMSNSLLDSSINKDSRAPNRDLYNCTVKPDLDVSSIESDSKQRFTSSEENIDSNTKTIDNTDPQTSTSEQSETFAKPDACLSGLLESKTAVDIKNVVSKSNTDLSDENESNEMAVGASNPSISTLKSKIPQSFVGSRLSEKLIVQPSSLIGEETTSPFNLNLQLPSNKNLKERISGIFKGTNLGGSEFGTKSDSRDDDLESLMLTGASERRPQINFPSLEPLKEINLNLFELNPLNLKLDKPLNLQGLGLNMNSLKAKVQVPNLNLKPLKLQSTIGKQDGLLGATLSLGPTSKNNLLATQQQLRESLNLPSLDEMKSFLQSRADDLMLRAPKLNVDNLRINEPLNRLDDLRETLHSNAAKHVNAIQQTLSSSMDEARVRADSLLGTTLNAQPENVFDTLSRARFDVDDRLQELHSTLADHLSSVHEMLNDPSFLTSSSPLMAKNSDISKIKSFKQSASATSGISRKKVTARKPSKPITSQESIKRSYKPQGKFVTSKSKLANKTPAFKQSMPRPKLLNYKNEDKQGSKMPTTSVLNVSRPRSQLSGPLLTRTQSANTENEKTRRFNSMAKQNIKTTESPPIRTLSVAPIKPAPEVLPRSPLFKRPIKPSPESERYRLALLTTTVSPRIPALARLTTANPWLSRPRNFIRGTTPRDQTQDQRNPQILRSSMDSKNLRDFGSSRLQESLHRFRQNSKSLNDASGSPSEQISTKIIPHFDQLKPGFLPSKKESPEWFTKLKPTYKVSISKMDLPERTGNFKPISVPQDINIQTPDLLKAEEPMTQPEISTKASIPGLEEKSILSKITESLKNRLSSMDLNLPFVKEKLGSTHSESDMMQGTSDILQTVVVSDDLMKEGVSYKCRMVCTRDK